MGTEHKSVRLKEADLIMRQAMLDAGVPADVVKECCHRAVCLFLERLAAALLDRKKVEIRGIMVGSMDVRSTCKMIIKLGTSTKEVLNNGEEKGIDLEDYIDG